MTRRLNLWFALLVAVLLPAVGLAGPLDGFVSPGPLARPHAHLDGITNCFSCHSAGQGVSPSKCMSCHSEIKAEVDRGTGFHADKGDACASCHPDHRGRDFAMVRMTESDFDHDQTGFPLRGAHQIACSDCHGSSGEYKGLDSACMSCHDDPHGEHPRRRGVRDACETCHTDVNWLVEAVAADVFDHDDPKQCDYALEASHRDVACGDCHPNGAFYPIAHDTCQDCHGDPHRTDFDAACEDCHPAPDDWAVAEFDHDRTPFRIRGRHRGVACVECHTDGVSKAVPFRRCGSCHPDRHRGEFKPKDCDDCHTVAKRFAYIDAFDHDDTPFPLTDTHAVTECDACHETDRGRIFRGLPGLDCDSCHTDEHDGRYEPVACGRCHTTAGFERPIFDHSTTNFPHTGSHVGLACEKCHTGGSWTDVSHSSCNDCHADSNPHDGMGPETCADCHETTTFGSIVFDHLVGTGFGLGLMHAEQPCSGCHANLSDFSGNEPECTACHDMPSKNHYEGDCRGCHEGAHWIPGGLGGADHAITGFPLKGHHRNAQCTDCHPDGHPRGEAVASCNACHTGDDPHRNMLGNVCEDCHTERSWLVSRFRHFQTGWPLQGNHRLVPCISCHAAGYVGTPTQCIRCHEADAPPGIVAHQSAYFPLCDSCHRPYGWALRGFPH